MRLSTKRILMGESVRSAILEAYGFEYAVQPGDQIQVGNEKATVRDILYSEVFIHDSEPARSSADVEFKDENGKYRHWQSWSDGGTLYTTDGETYNFVKES